MVFEVSVPDCYAVRRALSNPMVSSSSCFNLAVKYTFLWELEIRKQFPSYKERFVLVASNNNTNQVAFLDDCAIHQSFSSAGEDVFDSRELAVARTHISAIRNRVSTIVGCNMIDKYVSISLMNLNGLVLTLHNIIGISFMVHRYKWTRERAVYKMAKKATALWPDKAGGICGQRVDYGITIDKDGMYEIARAIPLRFCEGCMTCSGDIFLCGGCKMAAYCSKECQRAHWASHKRVYHVDDISASE